MARRPYTAAMSIAPILASVLVACSSSAGGTADVSTDAGSTPDVFGPSSPDQAYPGFCRAEVHRNRDRVPDAIETAHYDGRRLAETTFDSDRDGDADQRERFEYDDDNRPTVRRIDEGADGSTDEIHRYVYADDGRRLRETVDDDPDGEIDMTIEFDHDTEGRRTRGRGDEDGDDVWELILEFEWSEAGNLTLLRMDGLRGSPDDDPDRLVQYLYDEHGNRIEGRFDYDANGRADIIAFYRFDCWK